MGPSIYEVWMRNYLAELDMKARFLEIMTEIFPARLPIGE